MGELEPEGAGTARQKLGSPQVAGIGPKLCPGPWAESGKICHQQILFMDIELLHQKQSKRSYFHHQALSNESWMMRSTAGPAQLTTSSSATADAYARVTIDVDHS